MTNPNTLHAHHAFAHHRFSHHVFSARLMNWLLLLAGLLLLAPAQAQITFRAAGAQVSGTGASITPVIPAGTQAGDLAILIVAGRPSDTSQPAAPAGWTLRSTSLREAGANDLRVMTFYRVLTATNTNPAVTLPANWQGNARGASAQIAVWRGVNTTTPFDTADVTGNAAAAANWTPPALTTVTAGAWVVSLVASADDNALSLNTAQGFTARVSGASYDTTTGGDHAVALADKAQAAAGAVVQPTWRQTVNGTDTWAGITFALRPNAVPTVALTSPANNAVFAPGNINLAATATDDGNVAQVQFFNGATLIGTDTTAPYTFDWVSVPAGSYTVTARATDNLGVVTTSAPITINVSTAPVITLTSPTNNATYTAPANVSLTATATDDGSITQVQFYIGATLIVTQTAAPFGATLTGVPVGNYTLTARATDNLGVVTTSAPIAITVQAAAPTGMFFIHPDHLNTPRLITDQAGTAVWRWDNDDPFGNNAPNQNPSGAGNFTCNLRLPGQYFDRETNLHYNYFRDYDPAIGRYVQSDPIGLRGGLNTYAYVSGDPISLLDVFGLAPGDKFPTVRAAGVDAVQWINPQSRTVNWEYGGWIVPHPDGGYTYAPPVTDRHPTQVDIGPQPPNAAGWHHTHGRDRDVPSDEYYGPHDLRNHMERGLPSFLGTPSGRVREYPAPSVKIPRPPKSAPNKREGPC